MAKNTWRIVTRGTDGELLIRDFDSPETILRTHLQVGTDDCSTDLELRGAPVKLPTGREVLAYLRELWDNEITPGVKESAQVQRMKKFTNFIGEGIGVEFLHDIRRVPATADFWRVCEHFLNHDQPLPLEPVEK